MDTTELASSNEAIAARIASLSDARTGTDLSALAARLGLPIDRVLAAAHNERRFALGDLAEIAEHYGVTLEWLHSGREKLPVLN